MEIALAIAAVALVAAAVFAYATRPGKNSSPETKEMVKAIKSGRCPCGARLVKDLADGGDMAIFNCLNPECERVFMVDLSEEEEE